MQLLTFHLHCYPLSGIHCFPGAQNHGGSFDGRMLAKEGKVELPCKRFLAQVQGLALLLVTPRLPGNICLSFQANVCSSNAFLLEPATAVKKFISWV
jgi:hypothetical protein